MVLKNIEECMIVTAVHVIAKFDFALEQITDYCTYHIENLE